MTSEEPGGPDGVADPAAHVLRLVEAGVSLGAQTIRFEITRRELRASFEAPECVFVSRSVLERLFSVLVGSEPRDEGQDVDTGPKPALAAQLQLAVAMLAAMRMNPHELYIESVGADREGHRRVFVGRGQAVTERGVVRGCATGC